MKNALMALFMLLAANAGAQSEDVVPMADALRADGKIWVVVATVLIVLIGFFIYVIRMDGRIAKLEKRNLS